MLDKDTINKLTKIFYSDEFGMRNITALHKEAQKQGISLSLKDLKDGFYDHQEVVQMFSPLKKNETSTTPITASFTGEKIYLDTMFFKSQKLAVINAFDLHSKYAWAKPVRLKMRADETVESVSSRKTTNFFQQVEEDLHKKGFTIAEAVTDAGTEFLKDFDRYLSEQGIPHTVTEVGDHIALAPIDGYTRGLRLSAEKWLAVNPSSDLYKQIPILVNTYNNTEHSTIKMKPSEAIGRILPIPQRKEDKREPSNIKKGDKVRIVVRFVKNPLKKIKPNWSRELYTVEKANQVTRRFTLNDGKTYREPDIFKIEHPDKIMKSPVTEKPQVAGEPKLKQKQVLEKRDQPQRERAKPRYLVDFV